MFQTRKLGFVWGPLLLLAIPAASALGAADQATLDKGRAELNRCGGCHGQRIIATQRLGRGGWERELDKMVRWGAEIKEREALLVYLLDRFGDDKPLAAKPPVSADGTR